MQTAYAPPTPSARAGPSSGNGLRSRTPGRLFTGFAHGCAARHCAPRRRCAPRADEGQNPCPLRPPDANGMPDIDRRKATKGRRMARELAVGAKAPAFSLPRDGGDKVALKDFKGSKLVLYFYPKADTPGCTKEAIAFSKLRAAFAKAGTEILGVSADPVTAQDKFKTKHKLSISLASDETKDMLEAYGAWGEKSMYGRTFMGVMRKTFLIDAEGRIAQIWPKVRVEGHAEEVLEAARAL
ncbi:MAG TPA: thioredoxin-dependent thiol peroxidase [Pseudolabrys sp.]|nr:thioredoxin-dependent thiol peroxidase [Pseudolabrys sp.]